MSKKDTNWTGRSMKVESTWMNSYCEVAELLEVELLPRDNNNKNPVLLKVIELKNQVKELKNSRR